MNNKTRKREYLREWRRRNRQLNENLQDDATSETANSDTEIFDDGDDVVCANQAFCNQTITSDIQTFSAGSDENTSPALLSSQSEIEDLSDNNSSSTDYSLNSSVSSEDEPQEQAMVTELANWLLVHKISRTASNDLLTILRRNGHDDLPKCTRTVVQTPRKVASVKKCGGDYIYLGIVRGLNRVLATKQNYVFRDGVIYMIVNADGVPLFKSSGVQTWPILCRFDKITPFIVAVFVGDSKPNDSEEFLRDFLNEYHQLSQIGFEYKGHVLTVDIKAFVCDAPARQFLKGIKAHNGFYGCERCIVKGISQSSRMLFLELDCDSRDDNSFKDDTYMGTHQTSKSPLSDSGIKCVTGFPIDYMHLVCLGVVKRILLTWKRGPRHVKLSSRQIKQLSNNLVELKGKLPSEFARQPRSLEHVKRWKATEFRQFLLYTGCVVLKDVVSPPVYKHFLCLSLAISVFLEENGEIRNEYLDYANDLIRHFVSACPEIYGASFVVYNVHSLIHLVEDCRNFDCSLDDISCFPFENHLQVVKKYVRKAQNPLAQIVKRVSELENVAMSSVSQKVITTKISKQNKDSWFLLKSGEFCQIKEINLNDTFSCAKIPKHHYQSFFP